jgi:predicted transcriptional regulator
VYREEATLVRDHRGGGGARGGGGVGGQRISVYISIIRQVGTWRLNSKFKNLYEIQKLI